MNKLLKILLLMVVIYAANFSMVNAANLNNNEAPGVIVANYELLNVEQIIKNLNFILLQENDNNKKKNLLEVISNLQNTKGTIEHLRNVIKIYRKKINNLSQIKSDDSIEGSVECKACGGSGEVNGSACYSCGGDGSAWTPDANGEERPCGRCKGTGSVPNGINGSKTCPGCKGTGWANSSANPKCKK